MSESGNAGANSANSRQTAGSGRRSGWVRVAVASVLAPPVMFIAAVVSLLLVTNSFDPAFELGISDNLLNGILFGLVGLLAGIVVALVARMRGADLVLPPLVGLFVGVATFLAFVAFEAGEYVEPGTSLNVTLWIGQSVSIFLATRLTGYIMVLSVGAVTVLGVGTAAIVQAQPEPVAEVEGSDEPDPTEGLEIGESLPEWGGPLHGGGEFDSEVLRGRPALILVWSDGQPDAREALELFQSIVVNRQDQVGFVVVDTFDVVDLERLVQLLSEVDVTAPLVIDDTADLERVFKVTTVGPYWVVTNDTGVVVGVEYGMPSGERLIEMLNAAGA